MNDLISRSALMEYPFQRGKSGCDEANANMYFLSGVASVLEYAKNLPSVPAEVVQHGRWEERTFFNGCTPDRDLFCSCCNHDRGWYLWKYCPNCGCRMDGQGEGDAE